MSTAMRYPTRASARATLQALKRLEQFAAGAGLDRETGRRVAMRLADIRAISIIMVDVIERLARTPKLTPRQQGELLNRLWAQLYFELPDRSRSLRSALDRATSQLYKQDPETEQEVIRGLKRDVRNLKRRLGRPGQRQRGPKKRKRHTKRKES